MWLSGILYWGQTIQGSRITWRNTVLTHCTGLRSTCLLLSFKESQCVTRPHLSGASISGSAARNNVVPQCVNILTPPPTSSHYSDDLQWPWHPRQRLAIRGQQGARWQRDISVWPRLPAARPEQHHVCAHGEQVLLAAWPSDMHRWVRITAGIPAGTAGHKRHGFGAGK